MNSRRLLGFLIDYLITAFIFLLPFWFLVMTPVINGIELGGSIIVRALISTYIAFLYLILRDLPLKCSIGKRILKLKVVDSTSKQNAQITQKLIRNLTWLLGPVEIVYYLFTGKRIGDMIAKTEVVELE
ncbi:MAG: RDD family protein [Lentisphaerae bacterium]|nr:RDD family protein [Lentisphaerota bacterium]